MDHQGRPPRKTIAPTILRTIVAHSAGGANYTRDSLAVSVERLRDSYVIQEALKVF